MKVEIEVPPIPDGWEFVRATTRPEADEVVIGRDGDFVGIPGVVGPGVVRFVVKRSEWRTATADDIGKPARFRDRQGDWYGPVVLIQIWATKFISCSAAESVCIWEQCEVKV